MPAPDDSVPSSTGDSPEQSAESASPEEPPNSGAGGEPVSPPDSNWWYWVAAVPLYYVLGSIVGFIAAIAMAAFAMTGTMEMGPGMHEGFFVGGSLFFLGFVALVVIGLVVTLVFPLAIYFDADEITGRSTEWQPDPTLYGLLGLAGVVAQPLQVPLAVYYLYKRHEAVGQP